MDFGEALRLIKAGKRVRRQAWTTSSGDQIWGYVELVDFGKPFAPMMFMGGPMMIMGGSPDEPLRVAFARSELDILAEDWEIAE